MSDLTPSAAAPANDGVVAREWSTPDYTSQASDDELSALIQEERARADDAAAAVTTTEGKAARLLATTITLLTASVTLAALQLRASADEQRLWLRVLLVIAAVPASLAAVLLAVSALRAVDADLRVGVYGLRSAARLAVEGDRGVLRATADAAELALWTSTHKALTLMAARAWFTRGLLLAVLGLLLGAVTVALHH